MPDEPKPRGRFISRRTFLGVTLTAGSAVLLGVGGLLAVRGPSPVVAGLRVLTARQFRTLAALADALFPTGGAFAASAKDVDLARAFDGFLADEPPWNQDDLRNALELLELGPLIFDRRLKAFSALSAPERLTHFTAWMESDSALRRQAATAFRKFLSLVFYDQPVVWPGIGYPGPSAAVAVSR